jgi:hypothetical protein
MDARKRVVRADSSYEAHGYLAHAQDLARCRCSLASPCRRDGAAATHPAPPIAFGEALAPVTRVLNWIHERYQFQNVE